MTTPPSKQLALVCALLTVSLCALTTADALALRFATYNILNYSSGRTTEFQTVLEETQPDVIVVQEILSQSGVSNFLNTVLNVVNPGEWAAGDFVNGPDTDNAIFYKPAKATYVSHFIISTDLRDIDEWTIRPVTHSSDEANIRIYVVHLKASQGSTNVQRRLEEIMDMRERMETFPVGQSYIVTGDFNIYTASESGYQYMINPANGLAGVVQDPIQREGNWHINSSFADIHTQSPRTTAFGGGATGGMDDRFDMILVGPALQDGEGLDILEDTYTAVGQDGLHFDTALNQPPYVVVDSVVAHALHDASDHLPVFAHLQLPALLLADDTLEFAPVIVGGTATENLWIGNGATPPADDLDYSFAAPAGFTAPAGDFEVAAGALPVIHVIGMQTGAVGALAGDLIVTTDDPDHPTHPIALSGIVLDHAEPSCAPDAVLLSTVLDMGEVATDDTTYADALVHNFDAGPLQALLDVHDHELTGDPRFFVDGGFTPALVGTTPGSWSIAFDAAGAPEGAYEAELLFATRDQQDLSGAIELHDLLYALTVEVTGGTAAVVAAGAPAMNGIIGTAPNPFRPSVSIDFGLAAGGRADLRIFDVTGRVVRTLVASSLDGGEHQVTWDGRDATGKEASPGIYFIRLVTPSGTDTRKVVRLR